MFFLKMYFMVIKQGFIFFFLTIFFSTATILIFSDNVKNGKIRRNFLVRKTSKQNLTLDTFLVSGSLTSGIDFNVT